MPRTYSVSLSISFLVSAAAPPAAVYALCFADPFAWIAADSVLFVPFLRNILRQDYAYLRGGRGA